MCLYYCVFLHHEAEKTKETTWTQMLDRKSTNAPLLRFIFACALKAYLYTFYWTFGSNLSGSCCQIKCNMILKARKDQNSF